MRVAKWLACFCVASAAPFVFSQTDVLTQHNDSYRSGANLTETQLTPSNVNAYTFGLRYKLPVDGQVLAQPLVLSKQNVPGLGIVNLTYVVTLHNSVYCYALLPKTYSLVWKVNLGPSVPNGDTGTGDIQPEVGIVSTPVIDKAAGILYVVAKTKEAGPAYHSRIHALKLLTGAERANSPVDITGSVPGTAVGSSGGVITFDPLIHMNRPGLLLDHGNLYIGFGSHGDNGYYHGWVFAYDATSLTQVGIYNDTPNGDPSYYIPSGAGGVWMAGNGLIADPAGYIYFMTGNGTVSHDNSMTQLGNSIAKLKYTSGTGLAPVDFFAPFDSDNMNNADADLGSAGVTLIPSLNLIMGGGKTGDFFVVNTQSMGGIGTSSDNITQRFYATNFGLFTSPVYYFMKGRGMTVFVGGYSDIVKSYVVGKGNILSRSGVPTSAGGVWPGSSLSISANGQANGIIWSLCPDAKGNALLRAINAENLSQILYDSSQVANQSPGVYSTFAVATVANGLVLVPTFSNVVAVYGPRFAQLGPNEKVQKPTVLKIGPGGSQETPTPTKP